MGAECQVGSTILLLGSDVCKILQAATRVKGGYNLDITCGISGKPITKSNKYGMFCEDMCELEENKKIYGTLHEMMTGFWKSMEHVANDFADKIKKDKP